MRLIILVLALALISAACSMRRPESDAPVEDPRDKKIENLSSALSRSQSRIEELDAKLAALSDKMDSTRLTVDNLSGNKPLKVETVGAAQRGEQLPSAEDQPNAAPKSSKPIDKLPLRPDGATADFVKAMNLFKIGKYPDSELAFGHFTEVYPEHILAGSAQFFAGESYFMMDEYKLAINEYGKVISSFSSSPRVASAMVRLAHCYEQIGNTAEATRTLALAHDLFEGNPSLEWSPPAKKAPDKAPDKAPEHARLGNPNTPSADDSDIIKPTPMEPKPREDTKN